MSKTVKSLLRVFTLICVIVLVVFSIELVLLNREASGGKETTPPSTNETPTGTQKPTGKPQPSSPQTNSSPPPGESQSPSPSKPPPPKGKRYELQVLDVSEKEKLVVYAEEEIFEYSMEEYGYEFRYKEDEGKAKLEITPLAMPQGAAKAAESVLDGYLDGNKSNPGGPGKIKRSSLNGIFVSGVNGEVTYEAWIYSKEENSNNGILFVIYYRNDKQKNALYAVLDSLDIIKT